MPAPVFEAPSRGTCSLCGDPDLVVRVSMGVAAFFACDLCAHALRHHWQRALGERVGATTPVVVRTYALVPSLKRGREELDVSAYELLVGADGRLPSVDYARDLGELTSRLEGLGVATWPAVMRKVYAGYDGASDFSEVYAAWSWGSVPGYKSHTLASFEDLLAEPTPEAGFVLGVKAAFESLLWRREARPEDNPVCVRLREPAMRALRYSLSRGCASRGCASGDRESLGEDEPMVALCREAMSPEEREVVAIVEAASDRAAREGAGEVASKPASPVGDGEDAGEGGEPAPGFARAGGGLAGEE